MTIDPVYYGSGSNQSSIASSQLSADYENFLKLLTVQLQNQDPTAPTDTNQLTQQIAMLSQVEQQIATNQNLETLIAMTNATQYNSVVSYIGKQIEAPGEAGSLEDGEALFVYYLEGEADTVDITIKDEEGNVVYTGEGSLELGRNQFVWDGKNNEGTDMPSGVYTIEVEAKDGGGNEINSQTYTTGIVTAIDSAGGQIYLSFGELSVPIQNVVSVRVPDEEEPA